MYTYKRFTQGLLGSNTYVLWDEDTLDCALIDAGNSTELVWSFLQERGLRVRYIILTHAHYDHIYYFEEYAQKAPNAQVVIHPLDNEMLPIPRLNASEIFGPARRFRQADCLVTEGEILPLGSGQLHILHTPGHTPGGICVQADSYLFTGDTLFYDGFGRTDLGAGSVREMEASIDRLYQMPPDLTVFPGHGISTTIGREAKENPFMDF